MVQVTILDYFTNPTSRGEAYKLPNYLAPPKKEPKASISGTSTENTDPPAFAVAKPIEEWVAKARNSLEKLPRNHTLSQQYLASREEAMYHSNEGDVVRSAALYLIHPVNQVLSSFAETSGTIFCQSEYTVNNYAPLEPTSFGSNSKPQPMELKSTVRADLTFFHTPKGRRQQDKWRPFAAIEAKNRGIINLEQFQHAQMKRGENVDKIRDRSKAAKGATLYQGDAAKLMKQASAYAINLNTEYVALFNWDFLILVKFPELIVNDDMIDNRVGETCRTTIIRGSDPQMRAALLGFLLEAYEESTKTAP